MANANLTEKLLRLATSKQNAAAITGDLVQANASPLEHTKLILRMYVAATWRYAFGALLGLPLAFATLRMFAVILEHRLTSANLSGNPQWIFWSFMLTFCSISFSFIGALCLVRFGRKSSHTIAAFCIAGITILAASTTWIPHSGLLLSSLLSAVALTAIALPKMRKPVLISAGAALSFATAFAASFAGLAASTFHGLPATTTVYTVMTTSWIAAALIASITIATLHARFASPATQ